MWCSAFARRLRDWATPHVERSGRYFVVAIVCAILHNSIMIGLDRLGAHYVICQTASAAVLTPVGYLLQGRMTYRARRRSWRDFGRYAAALLTNYPVAIALLWLLCGVLKLDMMWAAPISMVVLFVWNYATSTWAFAGQPAEAVHRAHG